MAYEPILGKTIYEKERLPQTQAELDRIHANSLKMCRNFVAKVRRLVRENGTKLRQRSNDGTDKA
jgi:hypothetical protein